jgi:uncharacterized protein YcaQ
MITLSQDAVRGLMIAAQGLDATPRPPATKEAVLAAIRQMHLLQIDSINVIARAPYFVLWSHLGDYDPQWLDDLLEEVSLFEFRVIASCFIPIEDYPFHLVGNRYSDWRTPRKWLDEHAEVAEYVMNHIRKYGDTRATDFEPTDGQKHDWTNPKEEQTVLEYFTSLGELMVRKRDKFQRVFDLRERIYPEASNLPPVSRTEAIEQFVLYTVQALGVAKAEWVAGYYMLKHAEVKATLKRLEKDGRVKTVAVESWEKPGYVHPNNLKMVEAAAEGQIPQSKTTFLSPFDPLVSSRGRTLEAFDFDFPIEFYFPAAKRKYGYFSLPILYNNRLIGRLDPKAHRKEGIFEVKSIHLEPGVVLNDALVEAVQTTLKACAEWHKTPQVIIRDTTESGLADIFRID